MRPASHITRKSTNHIRPGDRLARSAKEFFSHAALASPSSSTMWTNPSSRKSRGGGRSLGPSADTRFQEVQRKICPVTGIYRDVSADYRVGSAVLGRGHYGVVRECEHRATRRILAVKSVDKSKVRRLDHLRREVYLLHKINHQGIMKLVDCCEDAKYVHIVTERYTGGALFGRIIENTTPEGCFSERKAASIIKSLLEAVAYLHDNDIVHRDITPGNILFESPREDASIRLIDFGLSRKHKSGETPMDNAAGTAYYMAPELLEGQYDRSCDVWSVGTVTYMLLCGYPPFNGETEPDIFKRIQNGKFDYPAPAWSSKSAGAKEFIDCLLRIDPRRRPTAMEALNHIWIKTNAGNVAKANDVRQRGDLILRIQNFRMAISTFKKSALAVGRREELS